MVLESVRDKKTRFAIGLSCGGSCTGVDAVLVRLRGTGPTLLLKLIKFEHFPHSPGLRNRLLARHRNAREIGLLNVDLGEALAEAAAAMKKAASEELCEVDFVASSGFTIAYAPPRERGVTPGILEIGEPAVISERTGLPVVSGFRAGDMAAGGQGAPLRAYADWVLFAREDRTVACLHLGSVASITVVTPNFDGILGFDIGPANMAIDGAMRILTSGNWDMDKDGKAAAKGVVVDEFLEFLLDHPYFSRVPPKGTGYDEFGPEVYLRDALAGRTNQALEDLVATVTASVGYSIARAFNRFVKPQHDIARLIVGGGGVANETLMKHVRKGMSDIVVRLGSDYGLPYRAFDACAAAILGNEAVCGIPANVPQATGARRAARLGRITIV